MVCFDGSLYFVDHQATWATSQEVQTVIDAALGSLNLAVTWEEL